MIASTFSLQKVPESQRLNYWQEAIFQTYLTVDCRRLGSSTLNGAIRARPFGCLELSEVTSPPMTYYRGSDEIKAGGEEHYQLVLAVEGHGFVEQRGNRTPISPGDLVIYSSLEQSEISFPEGSTTQVVKIPRSLLSERVKSAERIAATSVDVGSPAGMLVRSLVRECINGYLETPHHDVRVTNGLLEILAAAIESNLPSEACGRFDIALSNIKQYIEDHLSESELNVQQIAKRHSVSVRTLNRMFASEGTTAINWIWTRRLASSYKILSEGKVRQVSQAAFDCGFNDLSHFSRAFKKRYGRLPHEVLRKGH
ncbi:hypothetical protein WS61_09870 [Burkholderia sp. ABCPW 11]|uniref:AraC-like ligand-binding domain-containing protein n=1 Tax=Burkholderia sp. ABCPW 11 TaxID=1637859 RepID=UPI00075E90F1|nr:helix-turn-helix domain-containing protein [Burkholderia sp. ABCPW 11]KVD46798.1 hypothetical protein WS61_09870 [Burkholderia sp. ABCPW 11]